MTNYEQLYKTILRVYSIGNIRSLGTNGIIDDIYGKENILVKTTSTEVANDELFVFRTKKNFKYYPLHVMNKCIDILPLPYELNKDDNSIDIFISNIKAYLSYIEFRNKYKYLDTHITINSIIALLLHGITTMDKKDIIECIRKNNNYSLLSVSSNKEKILYEIISTILGDIDENDLNGSQNIYDVINKYITNSGYISLVTDENGYNIILEG